MLLSLCCNQDNLTMTSLTLKFFHYLYLRSYNLCLKTKTPISKIQMSRYNSNLLPSSLFYIPSPLMLLQEFVLLCTLQEGYFQQKKKKHKQCNMVMLYLTELSNHTHKKKTTQNQNSLSKHKNLKSSSNLLHCNKQHNIHRFSYNQIRSQHSICIMIFSWCMN